MNGKHIFRTVTLYNSEDESWCLPLAHVLGMEFTEAGIAGKDVLKITFSTGYAEIQGKGLEPLWARLLLDQWADGQIVITAKQDDKLCLPGREFIYKPASVEFYDRLDGSSELEDSEGRSIETGSPI